MPSSQVNWPLPLTRFPTLFPGQMGGVPGTDNETGLRMHTSGAVFYVDPNAIGVSDQRDGTNPLDPLATIAAALTKCQAYRGDVIAVMANGGWQYANPASGYNTPISEEVIVTVPGVRIVGVFPSGSPGVMWSPVNALGTCLTIHAIDVLVEGFAFVGGLLGGRAINVEWDGFTTFGDNVTIRHCLFDDDIDIGIQLENSWYAQIYGNFFQECDEYGIYVDPAGAGIDYGHIFENWVHNCGISNLSLEVAANSKIERNNVYSAAAQAGLLATDELIDTANGRQNIVAHNVLSCLLPVPANGDYDDACSSGPTDAWISNFLMDGNSVTNPT